MYTKNSRIQCKHQIGFINIINYDLLENNNPLRTKEIVLVTMLSEDTVLSGNKSGPPKQVFGTCDTLCIG